MIFVRMSVLDSSNSIGIFYWMYILVAHSGYLHHLQETHRSYDALQYPLIFIRGEDGYTFPLAKRDPVTKLPKDKGKITASQFYSFYLMDRPNQLNPLFYYRELFQVYIVDMFIKVETERLRFITMHQSDLRAELYQHVCDALSDGSDLRNIGQRVILPSSHTGSPRYYKEKEQDGLALVREYGHPDLFITFTANPKWPEIQKALLPGQNANHRHDIIARVFKRKLTKMLDIFKSGTAFGKHKAHMYTIEWQKRGLVHAHILMWVEPRMHADQIDSIISAEIPDATVDPELFNVVRKNMIHGPCGVLNPDSVCMSEKKCSKNYPKAFIAETQTGKDGYPSYRRRKPGDGGNEFKLTISKNKKSVMVDNRWVVPYCPFLSKIFQAHINVEFCHHIGAIKYVCKYLFKGSDKAMMGLQDDNRDDEVLLFQRSRYVSTNEAIWRILGFPIHEHFPPVEHLHVHLENRQRVVYDTNQTDSLREQLQRKQTKLTAFFHLCTHDAFASTLLYCHVPRYYAWQPKTFHWQRRKLGQAVEGWPGVKMQPVIGRIYSVHPSNSECFFLRILLVSVPGPKSFKDLKTFDGQICETFRESCNLRGLLEDDRHWDLTLKETILTSSPSQLRNLFAMMLVFCAISNPLELWQRYKLHFCEDLINTHEIRLNVDRGTINLEF